MLEELVESCPDWVFLSLEVPPAEEGASVVWKDDGLKVESIDLPIPDDIAGSLREIGTLVVCEEGSSELGSNELILEVPWFSWDDSPLGTPELEMLPEENGELVMPGNELLGPEFIGSLELCPDFVSPSREVLLAEPEGFVILEGLSEAVAEELIIFDLDEVLESELVLLPGIRGAILGRRLFPVAEVLEWLTGPEVEGEILEENRELLVDTGAEELVTDPESEVLVWSGLLDFEESEEKMELLETSVDDSQLLLECGLELSVTDEVSIGLGVPVGDDQIEFGEDLESTVLDV